LYGSRGTCEVLRTSGPPVAEELLHVYLRA